MLRQLRTVIIVNALLGVLFVYSNYALWDTINGFRSMGWGKTDWTPLIVNVDTGMLVPLPLINVPFILFWVLLITNLYFTVSLQRSKETKQTPS